MTSNKRRRGYYWVRPHNEDWIIAEWNDIDQAWDGISTHNRIAESDIDAISDQIEHTFVYWPKETHSTSAEFGQAHIFIVTYPNGTTRAQLSFRLSPDATGTRITPVKDGDWLISELVRLLEIHCAETGGRK